MKNATDSAIQDMSTASDVITTLSQMEKIEIGTTPKEMVLHDGKMKLYHFTRKENATVRTPVLIVYALVNRWEMMDLQSDRSFIKKLLEEGLDVYVVDWGYASRLDRYKTLADYILGDIHTCINYIRRTHDLKKVNLMGVCQGGTFSLIYSALHPERVRNLVTLVTPCDFDNTEGLLFRWSKDMQVNDMVDGFGGLIPGEYLNIAFDLLKPMNKTRKYMNLPETMKDQSATMNFLRMEKWVSDSPDQAGEAYRQFITDMYQKNKLVKGEFELEGQKVNLKEITMPVMTIYASEDHIVPPACTIPIHALVGSKDKELMEFKGGHIGVFVGSKSQKILAPTISNWLKERDKKSL